MGLNFFRRDDRDPKFVLFEYLDLEKLLTYEAFKDFTLEDFKMILEEGYKVAKEAVSPTLQDGDQQGLIYENGKVKVPASFHDCWKILSENGWFSLAVSPEYGGQGLPLTLYGQVAEYFISANSAMKIYSGLAIGASHLIESFGTEEEKALFCEKMYNGIWGGTMCLTEPDAGSDVGHIKTKATPAPSSGDARVYSIEGTKRFISSGEHDLTENIIHLVLARIEGAPQGSKGISLFIVPKIRVKADGSLGEPNDVFCTNIEHKMGLHGSATCGLSFGENGRCRGILLGEPQTGMAKMFQMMNDARIGTGLLAQGVAAAAYDAARLYAQERVQGPPFTNRVGHPGQDRRTRGYPPYAHDPQGRHRGHAGLYHEALLPHRCFPPRPRRGGPPGSRSMGRSPDAFGQGLLLRLRLPALPGSHSSSGRRRLLPRISGGTVRPGCEKRLHL